MKRLSRSGGFLRHLSAIGPILVIPLIINSCMTIDKGFITKTPAYETRILNGEYNRDTILERAIISKSRMEAEARKLCEGLPSDADTILSAWQLNRLFENLHENLHHDSLLQALVRTGQGDKSIRLLRESAGFYNQCFRTNTRVRRAVNRGNSSYGIPKGILNKTHRYLVVSSRFEKKKAPESQGIAGMQDEKPIEGIAFQKCTDGINEVGYGTINALSGLFGNFIGLFNREHVIEVDTSRLEQILEPLDIILVKSKTHLTDKFIPGFFGHAAIWSGSKSQLESMGWWNHRELTTYQPFISEQRTFVEGLRSGVALSPMPQFIDGETYLVLRMYNIPAEQKLMMVKRLLSHMNKRYDFNYDVQSPDRIFCSELIYLVYDQVDWSTYKTWGRVTLSPDDIAMTGINHPEFRMVALVTPDRFIENPDEQQIRELIGIQ